MDEAQITFQDLECIAVSVGPGSYTGLRIGVSAVKGLAYARNIPIVTIGTLEALAFGFIDAHHSMLSNGQSAMVLPMIDARRMEVYCSGFSEVGIVVFPVRAEVLTENSFPEAKGFDKVYYFGDGAEKCEPLLSENPSFAFVPDVKLSAVSMIGLAMEKINKKDFANTAYFEPFYLKDFLAGRPKTGLK